MARKAAVVAAVLVFFSLLTPLVHADRCILPMTDADVYGPGQKAIVAWNHDVERLILSTDLYASADTKVLEILPLPSEPIVDEGSFESFQAIQQLMMNNLPRVWVPGKEVRRLEITFHERIGAHDITVVRATSIDELMNFILSYTQKTGDAHIPSIDEKAREILKDYWARGFNYWVLDLVDLYSAARSIEPIVYEFRSSSLYYPLKVSATAKGRTEVMLYLITPEPIREEDIPAKMRFACYQPIDQAIRFQLSRQDLSAVDSKLAELFPVADGPAAWFAAVKYEGDLSDLDFDFEISAHPSLCRSITVSTDTIEYNIGETVKTTVSFTHLLPRCAEVLSIEVIHFHQVRLEVFDSSGTALHYWQWQTNSDLSRTVTWKPQEANTYVIAASSWWSGERLEVEDRAAIRVSSGGPPLPPDIISPRLEIRWFLYGVITAMACILMGAGIVCLLLRPKPSK